MKNKNFVKLLTFAVTLFFSVSIVTTISRNNSSSFFSIENNCKAKIYNFLAADKARYKKYTKRTAEQVLKLRRITAEYRLQLSPKAKDLHRKELEVIIKTLIDERLNADISELPEDFRESWSKLTIAEKNMSEIYSSGADSEVKRRSMDKLSKETITCEEEFRRVVNDYGFKLGSDLVLIDDES